ncbi:unnamed protein product [Chrysoparadoxa australica]
MAAGAAQTAVGEELPMHRGGEKLKLLVVSFNVGNSPLEDLDEIIPLQNGYDLIVIGLQESVYKPPNSKAKGGGTPSPASRDLDTDEWLASLDFDAMEGTSPLGSSPVNSPLPGEDSDEVSPASMCINAGVAELIAEEEEDAEGEGQQLLAHGTSESPHDRSENASERHVKIVDISGAMASTASTLGSVGQNSLLDESATELNISSLSFSMEEEQQYLNLENISGLTPEAQAADSSRLSEPMPSPAQTGAADQADRAAPPLSPTFPSTKSLTSVKTLKRVTKHARQRVKDWDLGAKHLRGLLLHHLGKDFDQICSCRRMQMRLKVFIHSSLKGEVNVEDRETSGENTGIGGVVANKGGLAARIKIRGTTLCFVSCHLQAHEGEGNKHRRNSSCAEILSGLRMGKRRMIDVDEQHDHCIWMGDLNFRLDFGMPFSENRAKVLDLISKKDWSSLLKGDELLQELAAGSLLAGFQDSYIDFPPTFKALRGSKEGYNEKRVPSYCDRILHKSLPGLKSHLKLLDFTSCPQVITSDHKPVRASFSVELTPHLNIQVEEPANPWGVPFLAPFKPQKRSSTQQIGPPRAVHARRRSGPSTATSEPLRSLVFDQLRAKNLTEMDSAISGGLSDPFLVFSSNPAGLIKKTKKGTDPRTETKLRTINPTWSRRVVCELAAVPVAELRHCHATLLVWDYDTASNNDLIGVANLPIAEIIEASPALASPRREGIRGSQSASNLQTGAIAEESSHSFLHAMLHSRQVQQAASVNALGKAAPLRGYYFDLPIIRNGLVQGRVMGRANIVAQVQSRRPSLFSSSSFRMSSTGNDPEAKGCGCVVS